MGFAIYGTSYSCEYFLDDNTFAVEISALHSALATDSGSSEPLHKWFKTDGLIECLAHNISRSDDADCIFDNRIDWNSLSRLLLWRIESVHLLQSLRSDRPSISRRNSCSARKIVDQLFTASSFPEIDSDDSRVELLRAVVERASRAFKRKIDTLETQRAGNSEDEDEDPDKGDATGGKGDGDGNDKHDKTLDKLDDDNQENGKGSGYDHGDRQHHRQAAGYAWDEDTSGAGTIEPQDGDSKPSDVNTIHLDDACDYDELSFELGWLKDIIKGLDIQILPLPTDEFDKLVELGRANYRTQAIQELSPKDIRLDVRQSVYGDEIPDVVFYDGLFRPG